MTPRTKEAFDSMRENTRLKIEAAALALFARKGLSVTVNEVAKAAGISQGLLYSHYPSKDALISELMRQATSISSQSISILRDTDSPAEVKIRHMTKMMCQMFSEFPIGIDYFMFTIQVSMGGFDASGANFYDEGLPNPIESLAEILKQGQVEGSVVADDPVQLATIYWATIQGLSCYAITGMPVTPPEQILNRILLKENVL